MTYYEKICKERCEWCAKDFYRDVGYHWLGQSNEKPCTAPTLLALIEELAAERDAVVQRAEAAGQEALSRVTAAEFESGRLQNRCVIAESTIATQAEQIRTLREALEKVPHASDCNSNRLHMPGFTHYETDAGEPCPSYHYSNGPCDCGKSALAVPQPSEVVGKESLRTDPEAANHPETARLDIAMSLLDRAAEMLTDGNCTDATWWPDLFKFTGEQMILTEEGWAPPAAMKEPETQP